MNTKKSFRLTEKDIPAALERFCALFPAADQPGRHASNVTRDGSHIRIANTSGTLVYMTTRWKFVGRIGGAEIESEGVHSNESQS